MIDVHKTPLEGLLKIVPKIYEDERGSFSVLWNKENFIEHDLRAEFSQDNFSISKKNVLRGIHYQTGSYAQGKMVRVIRGSVYDVAVDLRPMSKTFGKWYGEILSGENGFTLWLPSGFGHAFLTLSDEAEFFYKCYGPYNTKAERTLSWNDPQLNISWPLDGSLPFLSEKDSRGITLDQVREEEFSLLFDYFVN